MLKCGLYAFPNCSPLAHQAEQAALAGVLSTLFQLHLSVVSVECLTAE